MTGSHHSARVKLIFNPQAGRPEESSQQLAAIVTEMESQQIDPEIFTITPTSRINTEVRGALRRGIKLIVVAGGDGTIDSVARVIAGSTATLGIIPTGTRNNVALNLGIPTEIGDAVATLRAGRLMRVDTGQIQHGRTSYSFLEAAALGLLSDLYPLADEIQHGNLPQIGNLLTTFVSATPSRLHLILDGRRRFQTTAHVVLIDNMPVVGPHFQVAPDVYFNDGLLDCFVFSKMSKLNLVAYALQSIGGEAEDTGLKHYRFKQLKLYSSPQMPVIADGEPLGRGPLMVQVRPRSLKVVVGAALRVGRIATPGNQRAAATDE